MSNNNTIYNDIYILHMLSVEWNTKVLINLNEIRYTNKTFFKTVQNTCEVN